MFLTVSLSHPPNKIDCIRLLSLCSRSVSAPEGSMDMGLNNTRGCLGTQSGEHRKCEPSQEFTSGELPGNCCSSKTTPALERLPRNGNVFLAVMTDRS